MVRHDHVEESRLLAERGELGRRVRAQDGHRPVVSGHRVPRKEAGGRPDETMRHAPAYEIVHHPAEPGDGVDLSQVADCLLGLEVVERHRRDDDIHRPGRHGQGERVALERKNLAALETRYNDLKDQYDDLAKRYDNLLGRSQKVRKEVE